MASLKVLVSESGIITYQPSATWNKVHSYVGGDISGEVESSYQQWIIITSFTIFLSIRGVFTINNNLLI